MGGRTVFHGGTVFDGTGADLAHADVLIEDGRIVEVGSDIDADGGIDCAGKAVLPGLFDTHVHLVSRYEDFDEVRVVYPVRSSQAMTRSRSAIRTFKSAGLPSTSRFRGNLFFRRLVD